jgi:hypothetical protein
MARANFEVTTEQQEVMSLARQATRSSNLKEGVLRACQVAVSLARETAKGNRIFIGRSRENASRFVVPEFELTGGSVWDWLVERDHPWRKQLWVKGRKLLAFSVFSDMRANNMSREEAMDNWDLPGDAIDEIVAYCEENVGLIRAEAAEEKLRLVSRGVRLEAAR